MGRVQRGGREERIKEGEKQQGQKEPCDPSELSTMAPKESKRPPEVVVPMEP